MKKILVSVLLVAISVVFVCAKTITPKMPYIDDSCQSTKINRQWVDSPCYKIYSAEELYGFAAIVNGTDGFTKDSTAIGEIDADIVINEKVLKEDGSLVDNSDDLIPWIPLKDFSGCISSGMSIHIEYSISGLYFRDPDADNVGFIANIQPYKENDYYSCSNGRGLQITDSYFEGRSNVSSFIGYSDYNESVSYMKSEATVKGVNNVGGFVGSSKRTSIYDAEFSGKVVCTEGNCGGLIGAADSVTVSGSKNFASVDCGKGNCGGLAGSVNGVRMSSSNNAGNVTCGSGSCGGLIGRTENESFVENETLHIESHQFNKVYNKGNVSGDTVGGFCGLITSPGEIYVSIVDAYNVGEIKGKNYAGGFAGLIDFADGQYSRLKMTSSYNLGNVSGEGSIEVFANIESEHVNTSDLFFLSGQNSSWGEATPAEDFENGYLAAKLIKSEVRSSWGQDMENDKYPTFFGTLVDAEFPVTFNLYGGEFHGNCPETYFSGRKSKLPIGEYPYAKVSAGAESEECTVSKEGYSFVGWIDNDLPVGTVKDPKDLYKYAVQYIDSTALLEKRYLAEWTDEKFTVTYLLDGEIYHVDEDVYFNALYTVALEDPPEKEECTFDGWSMSGTFRMPKEDVIIRGVCEMNRYRVKFVDTALTSKTISYETDYVEYGSAVEIPDTIPETKYFTFVAWSIDGENPFDFSTPIKDETYLYALWAEKVETVVVRSNDKTLEVEVLALDDQKTILSKIMAAVEEHPEMKPVENYKDSLYSYSFEKWVCDAVGDYVPLYSKEAIKYEAKALVNGKEFKATLKTTYSEETINTVLTETALRNRELNFVNTYTDYQKKYTFVGWEKDSSGYYVPKYDVTYLEEYGGRDSVTQDSIRKEIKREFVASVSVENVSLEVYGMNLVVTGLSNDTSTIVYDMLGHVVAKAKALNGTCNVQLPNVGSYIVRIGKHNYKVFVK